MTTPKLPLVIVPCECGKSGCIRVVGTDGAHFIDDGFSTPSAQKEKFALIVRAVNQFDALREVAEAAKGLNGCCCTHEFGPCRYHLAQARLDEMGGEK